MTPLEVKLHRTLNRVTKWRGIFTGWQLGTRSNDDPEAQAVRDHREATILLRIEVSALARLMIDKGVFTLDEFHTQLIEEAEYLDKAYAEKFPGMKSTDHGISMDVTRARETMKGWKP